MNLSEKPATLPRYAPRDAAKRKQRGKIPRRQHSLTNEVSN
jgi:hypothetical protein